VLLVSDKSQQAQDCALFISAPPFSNAVHPIQARSHSAHQAARTSSSSNSLDEHRQTTPAPCWRQWTGIASGSCMPRRCR
jgi:hypothetical protein